MYKTDHFQLNQREKPDRVLMEDFNADNARLDAALAEQRRQQRAAQEAQTRQSAPTLHTDHSVQQAVSGAEEQARQHMPQAPTMSGGVYPVYDGQAAAQAKKEE